MNTRQGFTLVELMVTLAILVILLATTAPSLTELYQAYRANAAISKLQQGLKLARNQAISYGARVTLCPLENNVCGNDWNKNLTIFTDGGNLNELDGNDKILMRLDDADKNDIIEFNRPSVRYLPDGLASASNGTLKYCPDYATSPYSKALVINNAGKVRLSKTTVSCSH
ncbi:GspH/FimT family pseudopilin [Shewanella sedimentimangrovi]|uniref:Type II secretion system protein H n=1 Tax=Shewanella sedimentimangrovi TaxID=2814293 RepID=A0ABX7R488_9GAMM|nr:GspH/FimT family pseudopilin [Shewanella sedimentimangrovi]QSX38092.1 GspH/FimT family pseudopilin [Shewanella sedimentimangrovi]